MKKLKYLPLPPSANRYWRVFRGRPVRSKLANDYADHVREFAADHGIVMHAESVPIRVHIIVNPERPKDWARREKKNPTLWALEVRRMDLDNCGKVLLDALQGVAYANDKMITSYCVTLGHPIEGGGVEVFVEPDESWMKKEQT